MAVIFFTGALTLGVALAIGCSRRTLDLRGPGTVAVDAGGGGGGGASAGGGGASGGAGGSGVGGGGGSVPPGGLKKWLEPCQSAAECATGFCADGICCSSECSGPCARCDAPISFGDCVMFPAGGAAKPGGCPVEIAESCGNDGTCDGLGACRLRVVGTECGGGRCDGNTVVGRNVCDGRGACVAGPVVICVPYLCDPGSGSCRANCVTDQDCASGTCESGGRCHTGGGVPCQRNAECASGFCAGGICCNSACGDPCMTCNLQGLEGRCSPRPDGCPGADGGSD